MPRYDEAWHVARGYEHDAEELSSLHKDNLRTAAGMATRLRSVMQELSARDDNHLNDWLVVINALGRMGNLSLVEAVVRDMPETLRNDRTTQRARLGAVHRWCQGLQSSNRQPEGEDIELANNTFWDVFRTISASDPNMNAFTFRLLLTTIASMSELVATRSAAQAETVERLDGLMRYILQQAYGLDLKNLAVSVQARDAGGDSREGLLKLSAKGLTAVMTHLIAMRTEPYRLVAIYEMLTKTPRVAYSQEEIYEEEEMEDDYYVAAEPSEGDVGGAEGPVQPKATRPSYGRRVDQNRRKRIHFLSMPVPPSQVVPLPPAEAARLINRKPLFSPETVTAVLAYLREHESKRQKAGNRFLFQHFLETAVSDVQEARSRWLAAYLGAPDHCRPRLRKAVRAAPEWFRQSQGRDTHDYGRGAALTARLIQQALKWNQEELSVIFEKEKSLRGHDDLRAVLEYPEWAKDPRERRIKRNLEVFIAPDELRTLAQDTQKLQALLDRAKNAKAKRRERRGLQQERRRARDAEADTERLRLEALQQEKDEVS